MPIAVFLACLAIAIYWTPLALPLSFAALVAASMAGARIAERRGEEGSIALEPGGIRISAAGHESFLAKERIVGGCEWPLTSSVALTLTDGSTHSYRLEEVERLLAHLGLGVGQRTFTFRLRRTIGPVVLGLFGWMLAGIVTAAVSTSARWYYAGLFLIAPLFGVLFGLFFGRPSVTVGSDGIRLSGGFSRRFISYERIERVNERGDTVDVTLKKTAERIELPFVAQGRGRVVGIAHRIERARRAATGQASLFVSKLGRGSSSVEEWRARVATASQTPAGFRDQAIGLDDLERALGDAGLRPDERIGAALAYRAAGGEPARIRVAAEASADVAMKDALEAAAEEEPDLEAIDRATRG